MDARLLKKLRKEFKVVTRNGQYKAIYPYNESKWTTKEEAIEFVCNELARYVKNYERKPKGKLKWWQFK